MAVDETSRGPIRVLWLIKGLGPGGAEQLLVSSAVVADHDTFDIETAYVREDKHQFVPALASANVRSHLLGEGSRRSITWPLHLRRMMGDFDIVHSHSPLLAGVARTLALTLPPKRRPTLVSTEHNVWGNFALPTRLLNALTCTLDAQRWSVSGEVQRSMWGRLGRGAPVLVHGIVQDGEPGPIVPAAETRDSLGIPPDAVVAIIVANLRKEKDYPNLLHASQAAFRENKDLYVLAVGQGPLAEEVEKLHHSLELGDRFRLLGYRADVRDLLAASDIFVLSSEFEGLPVSIMEAMAMGLPVVATTVGGVPEAVTDGETGRLVPPHNHQALAAALLDVASDRALRKRMGYAAKERSHIFDIRNAVSVQQRAYRKLTGV